MTTQTLKTNYSTAPSEFVDPIKNQFPVLGKQVGQAMLIIFKVAYLLILQVIKTILYTLWKIAYEWMTSLIRAGKQAKSPAQYLTIASVYLVIPIVFGGFAINQLLETQVVKQTLAKASELHLIELDTLSAKQTEAIKVGLEKELQGKVAGWKSNTQTAKQVQDTVNSYLASNCSAELHGQGELFYSLGKEYRRHPYAILAVMTADSSCGLNLTTAFNYGNVGNTDSCPTCSTMQGMEVGVRAVFQTLSDSNPYLKNATKLCHLSRGGWNSCKEGSTINSGKYYASSLVNWQNNTNAIYSILSGVDNAGNTERIIF
jgi:hypothetical protein